MMPRYTTKPPQASWDDDERFLPSLNVDENKPAYTGLVDAKGDKIYRVQPPAGFGRDKEW